MSESEQPTLRTFAETIAPYVSDDARGPHTKLSISLPTELVEQVRDAAATSGTSVSATIAASLRHTLEEVEQARLDAAIEAQNEENLEWALAFLPMTAKLWSELEW